MSRSAKPQNGRRRFLRDVVRTAGGLAAVGVALGLQQQTARASGVRLRPPGAINENAFASACVRCGQCVQACPYDTLKLATLASGLSAGTPYFVARDIPCEMCEDIPCAKVCPSGALDREIESIDDARMGLAVLVDQENCLNFQGLRCDVCYRECPKIDEAITLEVVSEIFTHVNVRYVNADTKTEIAQNTTNFTTLPTAAVSTTAGSGSISFQLKTTSTDNISYTIKQGDTVVKTATTSAANASVTAASLTVAQTAEVVVEISGLSAAKAKYDYTNSLSSSGDNLSAFGVAGTTDASGLKLTIAVTPGSLTTGTANITEGEVYTLSATLSGNPADASAYKVSIPSLGLEFVLSKAQRDRTMPTSPSRAM